MKIALNATCLNNRPSGARQRFIGIYNELFHRLPDYEFIVYQPNDCDMTSWFDSYANVSFKKTPLLSEKRFQKFFRGLFYWPNTLKIEKPDILECYHLPMVKASSVTGLLTIHDIRDLVFLDGLDRFIYKTTLDLSFAAANHVIAVSESMKNDILEFYPNLKVSVIYNGIDAKNFERITNEDTASVRIKLNLPENFLLSVGHFEKRKNYLSLVDSLALLHAKGFKIHLVLVGNDSGELATVKERVQTLGLSNFVMFFTGLSDYEVGSLYKLSNLFVFPSIYEGFGIPILEAMAASCPIVLSDIPVFREITEGQGVYFSPLEPESMAKAIEDTLSARDECLRIVEYGKIRVQDFSFSKIASDLAQLYKSIK